jgi:hypothetical protein
MKSMMTLGITLTGKDNLSPTLNKTSTQLGRLDKTLSNNRGKSKFNRALGSMATKAKKTSKVIIGSLSKMSDISTGKIALLSASFGAVAIGMGAVNKETAKMANLAETVGLSYSTVSGLGGAIKSIGLDYEHVIDIKEELDNKMGESKSIYAAYLKGDKSKPLKLVGGLEDAFKGLDFSLSDKSFKNLNVEETFKKFSKLDGDGQFKLVMDTALKMEDTQKAQSMVDIIMGGEANKILGYLRKQGMTYDELLAKREKMNFMTKESLNSARLYSKTMGEHKVIIGSIVSQFSAVGGAFMSPYIQDANNWLILNKELIQQNITGFFDGIGSALGTVNKVLGKLHSLAKPIIGLFGETSETLEQVSNSGETAGATLVYLATGLIGLKVATSVGSLGLKVLTKSFSLLGRKSKVSTSLISGVADAVGDLAQKTRKPLSLQMGMKMPVKKTILGRLSSMIGTLSKFAKANPISLIASVVVLGGIEAMTKKSKEIISDRRGGNSSDTNKELKERLARFEQQLKIQKGGGTTLERATHYAVHGSATSTDAKNTERQILATKRAIGRKQNPKEKRKVRTNKSKEYWESEVGQKEINEARRKAIEYKNKNTKPTAFTPAPKNSFLSSVAPIKKEITNNKEVQINAPINITVNAVEGKAPVAEIARAVQESLKRSVRSQNNNVSHLDEEI